MLTEKAHHGPSLKPDVPLHGQEELHAAWPGDSANYPKSLTGI